jgi:hypothetical protein
LLAGRGWFAATLVAAFASCAWGQAVANEDSAECTPASIDPAKFFLAGDRIGLNLSAPLKGGEVNELTLVLHGPPISCVSIEEDEATGVPVSETVHSTRVFRRSDGSQYVLFTPVRLGKVGIQIGALFPDGGLTRFESTVEVEPSDSEPALLMMQAGGGPGTDIEMWRLGLNDSEWQSRDEWFHLWSSAYCLDSKLPVQIDRAYMHFAVKQPQDNLVIELSDDGGMRPLRVGDALLETTFGTTTRETCIQVREDSSQGDNSRCGGLRSPRPDAPLDTIWTHNPEGLASQIHYTDYFVSQLSVSAPSQPVGLAQLLDIPVKVSGGKVRFIYIRQNQKGSGASILSSSRAFPAPTRPVRWQGEEARVVQDDGETKVIEITPVGLGEETVSVAVEFEDGGFDERYFHIRTVPSDGGLEKVGLNFWNPQNTQPHMTACLKYSQLANCLPLSKVDGLQVTVDQPDKPVVRVDPDGTIHELGVGTAKVTVGIGNVKQSLELHVNEPLIP